MNETVITGIIDDSSEMQGKMQYAIGAPGPQGVPGKQSLEYLEIFRGYSPLTVDQSMTLYLRDFNRQPDVGEHFNLFFHAHTTDSVYVHDCITENVTPDGTQIYVKIKSVYKITGEDAATDQTYSPTSENAQSGVAVAEAVSNKQDKFATISKPSPAETQLVTDTPYLIINALGLNIRSEVEMNSGNYRNKIVGLGDPENQYDAANKGYVDTSISTIIGVSVNEIAALLGGDA